MGRTAVACCPGHISGYFRRVVTDDPLTTGSAGAGLVIEQGVIARVTPAGRTSVTVRRLDGTGRIVDERSGSPVVEAAMASLGVTAAVTTESILPSGCGFGSSAAAVLASIIAADACFELGLGPEEQAASAHRIEIEYRTGLGDVAGVMGGGLVCRCGAGINAPVERISSPGTPIAAVVLGPIPTAEILSSPEKMERIQAAYPDRCPQDLGEFFAISREFAEKSGLVTPAVMRILESCDRAGIPATMMMLGEGVVAAGPDAESVLKEFGELYSLKIADGGPRLLEVVG
ncbi:MAG: GHMP family kinase ATP-binding protein [Methanoculleaceae archaeon]